MKNLYSLVLLVAFPFTLWAQSIHGLWSGTLVNDSTHRKQNFELGLSEYRGKITGYTYTTFIENDTFYYSVKRVKAERRDGKLMVEDVEMVGNNFPEKAAKHVKQITSFPLINDSTFDIANGRWTTNQTKKYYSIGGSAGIKEQEEEKESDLLAHLTEMKVKNDIAIKPKEKKENAVAKNSSTPNKDAKRSTTNAVKTNTGNKQPSRAETSGQSTNTNNDVASIQKQPENIKSLPIQNTSQPTVDVNSAVQTSPNTAADTKPSITADKDDAAVAPASGHSQSANNRNTNSVTPKTENRQTQNAQQQVAVPNKGNVSDGASVNRSVSIPTNTSAMQQKSPEQKKAAVGPIAQQSRAASTGNNTPAEVKVVNPNSISTPSAQRKESIEKLKELPAAVAERKNETIDANIYFKNDSLVLSLYDNGIVDGDTVSVFVNGDNIISRQKLKEAATKKTIYIAANTDSVQLVLFAENLGTIPPNTGLLTVRDGDDVYQVRFSADLQKNASLLLRRKKQ